MDHLKKVLNENGKVHWRELASAADITAGKSKSLLEDYSGKVSSVWVKWVEEENDSSLVTGADQLLNDISAEKSFTKKRVYSFEKEQNSSIVCIFDKNHAKVKSVADSPLKLVRQSSKIIHFKERNRNPILRKIDYKFKSDMNYLKARYIPIRDQQLKDEDKKEVLQFC